MSNTTSRGSLSPMSSHSSHSEVSPSPPSSLPTQVSTVEVEVEDGKRPGSGSDTDSETSGDRTREKTQSKNPFSIQSILARPEPMRPADHPLPYAHILQANFPNCFPHKFAGSAMFYPWMQQAALPDFPENLSTKHSFSNNLSTKMISANESKCRQTAPATTKQISKSPPDDASAARDSSKSPSPSSSDGGVHEKSPGGVSVGSNGHRRKKTRTVFSRNQVFQLESTFDMKRYLSSAERAGLAASLNLSEQQIKIWFQNRRNKWKRQLCSDLDASSIASSQARFQSGSLSMPVSMYAFPGVSSDVNSSGHPSSHPQPFMPNLFCPSALHSLYMGGHLPFPRPSG